MSDRIEGEDTPPTIPEVGKSSTFKSCGHTFRITRPRKNTCCLRRIVPPEQRARFGTVPQIRKDCEHVVEFGRLPPPEPGRIG